jgi:transcriptional regulator with XRE-family HTH domain
METINDRMEMLVNERFNGNKAAFAKSINMSPTSISSYLGNKRRSKPSVDMVAKIVLTLDVDAKWLLTGEETQQQNMNTNMRGNVTDSNVAIGSHNSVGNVSVGTDAVLAERIKALEALLAEKERLIKVYEKMVEK